MRLLFILLVTLLGNQMAKSQDVMYEICPIKVGEQAPDVSLTDSSKNEVLLSELTLEKPTVLIFYRGAWCGYCTKHLAELNEIKTDVEKLGFQMLGITVDQSSKLQESTKRSQSEIQVYSDSKLEAINAFGLDWQVEEELFNKYKEQYKLDLEDWSGEDHHSLPVPAIYIIKDGIIQFQYVNPNYRSRLKPETLLAILETL